MEGKYRVRYHSRIVLLQEKWSSKNKTLLKNHPITEPLMQDNVYYERISTGGTDCSFHRVVYMYLRIIVCVYYYALIYMPEFMSTYGVSTGTGRSSLYV